MEIYRRLGIAQKVREAGYPRDAPMDVFIVTSLIEPPLLHLPYPSVAQAQAEIAACADGSMPLEPYQLISQYTLEAAAQVGCGNSADGRRALWLRVSRLRAGCRRHAREGEDT
jgi:hypothetical protein